VKYLRTKSKGSNQETNMKWEELIKATAWVVDDLLTPEECTYFLKAAEAAGIDEGKVEGDVRNRNSVTVSIENYSLAELVFERIKYYLPQEVWVDKDCDNLGLRCSKELLYGKWKPYALNSRWRIARYSDRGHFAPHRDGCRIVDEHHRSLITINGYLTDRPTGFGGATRFVKDDIAIHKNEDGIFTTPDSDVTHSVEADKAGKAVLFFHDLMHDGEQLKEGSPPKWLFRTEVIFERDPETAPKKSQKQIEARKFLLEAEKAEEDGKIPEAIQLYKKAYRLDPILDCGSK